MRPSALILTCAASLLFARPATAESIERFEIGNWEGGAYTNTETGKFSHCSASASYRDGNTLVFSIFADRRWGLAIVNKDWTLKVGDTYPVLYRIDNGRERAGKASAIADNQIGVALPGDDALFDDMRHGNRLTITLESQTATFDLTSTGAVLRRLFECVAEWRERRE